MNATAAISTPRKPKRRWFQFSVRTLLALPVLFAIGWWWATWSERTTQRFITLVRAGEFAQANRLLQQPVRWMTKPDGSVRLTGVKDDGRFYEWPEAVWCGWFEPDFIHMRQRSLADVAYGRCDFDTWLCQHHFSAQYGTVSYRPCPLDIWFNWGSDGPPMPKAMRELIDKSMSRQHQLSAK